jgi:hypothetical protein
MRQKSNIRIILLDIISKETIQQKFRLLTPTTTSFWKKLALTGRDKLIQNSKII